MRVHEASEYEYNLWQKINIWLKSLILQNYKDEYISELKLPRTRCATIIEVNLMKHFWTTYGKFDINNLNENEKRTRFQWAPPHLIESLCCQPQDVEVFFLEGNDVISDSQLVQFAYDNIITTEIFDATCTK